MAYDSYLDESKPLAYAIRFLYSLIVVVLWIPAFILRRIGRFMREAGVESWPRTSGSITAGDVNVVHGWVVDYALGRLDYSYRVAGEYYAGSFTRQYPDEQAAWDFVDARRGKAVVVRYRDSNAQSSALWDADQEPSWTDQIAPGIFVMIWRHWRDELQSEAQLVPDNGDLGDDDTLDSTNLLDTSKHRDTPVKP
jgi:hypothetical protein